jgi:hypothetical protein
MSCRPAAVDNNLTGEPDCPTTIRPPVGTPFLNGSMPPKNLVSDPSPLNSYQCSSPSCRGEHEPPFEHLAENLASDGDVLGQQAFPLRKLLKGLPAESKCRRPPRELDTPLVHCTRY